MKIVTQVACLCGLSFLVGCESMTPNDTTKDSHLNMEDVVEQSGDGARNKIEAMSLYSQAVLEAKSKGEIGEDTENKLFEVIARDPDAAEPYSILLDKWNKRKSTGKYIERLIPIYAENPQSLRLSLVLVSLLEKEKRYEAVTEVYEQTYAIVSKDRDLQKKSDNGELWRLFVNGIVNSYRRSNRLEKAEKVLSKLNYDDGVMYDYVAVRFYLSVMRELHVNPNLISKDKKDEYNKAVAVRFAHAREMLAKKHYPINTVTPLVEMLVLNSDIEGADAVIVKNIENDPDDAQSYVYRAVFLERLRRYKKAFGVWKALAGRSLKAEEEYFPRIIDAAMKAGELDYALEKVAVKLDANPDDAKTLYLKARIYHQKKEYDEALSLVEKTNNFPQALLLGAEIQEERKKWKEAIEYIERYKGLSRKGNLSKDFYFYYANVCVSGGFWDKCNAAFDEVIKLYPKDAQVLNYVGYTWIDNNMNLEKSLDYILMAVTFEPKNIAYIDSLMWAYYKMKQYEDARGVAETIFERRIVVDDAVIYDHIGDIYDALEMKDKAIEMWRNALKTKSSEADFDNIKKKLGITEKKAK